MWRKYDAMSLATLPAFKENPSRVWQFYHYRREKCVIRYPHHQHLLPLPLPVSISISISPPFTHTKLSASIMTIPQSPESPTQRSPLRTSHALHPHFPKHPHILPLHQIHAHHPKRRRTQPTRPTHSLRPPPPPNHLLLPHIHIHAQPTAYRVSRDPPQSLRSPMHGMPTRREELRVPHLSCFERHRRDIRGQVSSP